MRLCISIKKSRDVSLTLTDFDLALEVNDKMIAQFKKSFNEHGNRYIWMIKDNEPEASIDRIFHLLRCGFVYTALTYEQMNLCLECEARFKEHFISSTQLQDYDKSCGVIFMSGNLMVFEKYGDIHSHEKLTLCDNLDVAANLLSRCSPRTFVER
jgi:hypothetical protein